MITIDRAKIRKLVSDWMMDLLDDDVFYTNLSDIVLEGVNPTGEEITDGEWEKVEEIIVEAYNECKTKVVEILTQGEDT